MVGVRSDQAMFLDCSRFFNVAFARQRLMCYCRGQPRKLELSEVYPDELDPVPVKAILKTRIVGDLKQIAKNRSKTFKNNLAQAGAVRSCFWVFAGQVVLPETSLPNTHRMRE